MLFFFLSSLFLVIRITLGGNSTEKCCRGTCEEYRGETNIGVSGLKCQPWASLPTSHKYHPDKKPNSGLESNYCRNPSKHKNAWCYVKIEGGTEWADCRVQMCDGWIQPQAKKLIPTIKTFHPFDKSSDARDLYKAMKGAGTTESTIINILTHRTLAQRKEIADIFTWTYHYDFRKWLFGEVGSGPFGSIIWALMYDPVDVMTSNLYWAMKGAGTNEQTLIDILVPLNTKDKEKVVAAFQKKADYSLRGYVIDDTSGYFRELLLALIFFDREEEGNVDIARAKKDAATLNDAITQDQKQLRYVLTGRSWAHLKKTFEIFEQVYDDHFDMRVKKQFSSWYKTALLSIYQYAMDPHVFFAYALKRDLYYGRQWSFGYLGYKGERYGMARVFSWRSEIDLGNIAEAFKDEFRITMKKYIQKYCGLTYCSYSRDTLYGILE